MEMRCYEKAELAMLYFPHLPATLAMRKLRRWIRYNPELDKNADFYSKRQVKLIVEYLDEP